VTVTWFDMVCGVALAYLSGAATLGAAWLLLVHWRGGAR
jgi:hypothetical protein